MRVLKDNIYIAIQDAARNEFIDHGFKDASMRTIARNAGVSPSNIYNYFTNKDKIFMAIVQPARDDIFTFITQQHTEDNIDFTRIAGFGHHEDIIEQYIDLIGKYKQELRILLYHSEGSSMNNFRDVFTDHLTQVSHDYMKLEKMHYPHNNEVSHFFIHTLSSWMVSILGEIVTHNLGRHRIREFFREYFRFTSAGWNELTKV